MTADKTDHTPEHSDDFEEEFDFDEISIDEGVLAEEPQAPSQGSSTPVAAPEQKSSALPLLIGLTIVSFIGWKVYGMLTTPKKAPEVAQATVEKIPPKGPELVAQGKETTSAEVAALENKIVSPKPTAEKNAPAQKVAQIKTPSTTLLPNPPPASAVKPQPTSLHIQSAPALTPATPTPVAHSSPSPALPAAPAQANMERAAVQPTTTATTTMPAANTSVLGAPATNTLPPPVENNAQSLAVPSAQTKEAFEKLEKELNNQEQLHKEHFATLEKNLTLTAQNSANTNKSVAALEQEVTALTTVIHELTQEIKTIREEQTKIRSQQTAKVSTPIKTKPIVRTESNPTLSIHAIIPGRAWLKAQDGKMLTVAEGDAIGEYGKVLKIDAANGVVVTTSGVTLR